jgi:uncharacterized membrane protein
MMKKWHSNRSFHQNWSKIVVGLLIILYIGTFSITTILQHRTFHTHAYDLSTHDQAVWNTLHGELMRITTLPGVLCRLGDHFDPILLLIAPLYYLYDSPETLLIIQTVVVALGAWPVFQLARKRLETEWGGIIFALAYLLYTPLESANMFDFHGVTLVPSFLLFALYFLEVQRWLPLWISLGLAIMCKEDISLIVAALGLYVMVRRRNWKQGLAITAFGAVWFLTIFLIVMPHFSLDEGYTHMPRYAHLGETPEAIIRNLVTHPQLVWHISVTRTNVWYVFMLLAPLAFAPMFSLDMFAISLPSLCINLWSNYLLQHMPNEYHYATPIIPFTFAAGIYGLAWIVARVQSFCGKQLGRNVMHIYLLAILTFSLGIHYYRGFSPLSANYRLPRIQLHHRIGDEFVMRIPPEASVSTQSDLAPHVSHRRTLYVFPEIRDADYVFLDVTSNIFPSKSHQEYEQAVHQLLNEGPFELLEARDGYLLLQRSESPSNIELPTAFFDFARAKQSEIQHPLQINYPYGLSLEGYNVSWERDGVVQLVTYWKAPQGFEKNLRFSLYQYNLDDAVLALCAEDRTTPWYPTSQWSGSELVRVVFGPLGFPWASHFALALRVEEVEDGETRTLLPSESQSRETLRIYEDTALGVHTFRYRWLLLSHAALE